MWKSMVKKQVTTYVFSRLTGNVLTTEKYETCQPAAYLAIILRARLRGLGQNVFYVSPNLEDQWLFNYYF